MLCTVLDDYVPAKSLGLQQFSDLITHVKDRPGHDRRYAIDAKKIRQDLNWSPQETFATGIRKTVEWYLQR
jgi:dTDP-glucose 4,6-dehydratase